MLKYIPLVKHTSCTIMLDMPALDLSVVIHPIKIPSDINKIDISNNYKVEEKITNNIDTGKIISESGQTAASPRAGYTAKAAEV